MRRRGKAECGSVRSVLHRAIRVGYRLPVEIPVQGVAIPTSPNGISLRGTIWCVLKQALKNQTGAFLIMDAHCVKNTDSATFNGHDAGKKALGIKRTLR